MSRRYIDYNEKDEMLAVKAQNGDMYAEEYLMRKYKSMVKAKASMYFMAGGDEQDVIQEGMIGLFKAIGRFNPAKNASFATYAGICVTSQIITAIRTAERKKHDILNNSISFNNSIGKDTDKLKLEDVVGDERMVGPEEALLQKDTIRYILKNDDNRLSNLEKSVLNGLMKGQSYDDIAVKLEKSTKSIDNAVRRAKKKIVDYIRG